MWICSGCVSSETHIHDASSLTCAGTHMHSSTEINHCSSTDNATSVRLIQAVSRAVTVSAVDTLSTILLT